MRKLRGFFISLSAAALMAMTALPVYAQETETETVSATELEETSETVALQTEAAPAEIKVAKGEISEADSQTLASYAEESIGMVTGMTDEQLNEIVKPSSILSVPVSSVTQSVQSWLDAREKLGAFNSVKEHLITVDDDTITIESTCDFANTQGVVTTVLDRDTLTMNTMTFSESDSSLGKVMTEAALNTLMGLGIVFLTLLFLSFLIGQFKHISKLEKAFNKEKDTAAPVPAAPAPAAPAPAAEEETVDDGELIAVIAAAVAAYEGTATDGFVVRSIKKSNRNKWQRA